MTSENSKTNWGQFIPLVIVFFFWGFVAASNDILIPVFRQAFDLTQVQSQLVSLAFYIAYTVGSLIYLLISYVTKGDLINRIGYKNALALGLGISALGTLLFYPAANNHSFPLMLSGLFIVALGFSLQQTVANPLAIALGPITTGSQRLTLAGGINNLGTTIGPLIVSFAIFGSASSADTKMSIESVKIPYLILGVAFLLVAILLKFSSLPDKPQAIVESESDATASRSSALKYPQLILGMIAIFVYVGVEVSTASNLPAYMEKNLGFLTKDIAPYISLYWASLMIGRWTGAVEAFTDNMSTQKILRFIAPYLAFGGCECHCQTRFDSVLCLCFDNSSFDSGRYCKQRKSSENVIDFFWIRNSCANCWNDNIRNDKRLCLYKRWFILQYIVAMYFYISR